MLNRVRFVSWHHAEKRRRSVACFDHGLQQRSETSSARPGRALHIDSRPLAPACRLAGQRLAPFDSFLCLAPVERVRDVRHWQDSARMKDGSHPVQRHCLPEVGEGDGAPRVDEAGRASAVLLGEEPGTAWTTSTFDPDAATLAAESFAGGASTNW